LFDVTTFFPDCSSISFLVLPATAPPSLASCFSFGRPCESRSWVIFRFQTPKPSHLRNTHPRVPCAPFVVARGAHAVFAKHFLYRPILRFVQDSQNYVFAIPLPSFSCHFVASFFGLFRPFYPGRLLLIYVQFLGGRSVDMVSDFRDKLSRTYQWIPSVPHRLADMVELDIR
jgi:hypothetical protein